MGLFILQVLKHQTVTHYEGKHYENSIAVNG